MCIVLCIVCALSRNELASCSGSKALRTAALTLPLGVPFYSNPTSQSGRAASMGEGHLGPAAWSHYRGSLTPRDLLCLMGTPRKSGPCSPYGRTKGSEHPHSWGAGCLGGEHPHSRDQGTCAFSDSPCLGSSIPGLVALHSRLSCLHLSTMEHGRGEEESVTQPLETNFQTPVYKAPQGYPKQYISRSSSTPKFLWRGSPTLSTEP